MEQLLQSIGATLTGFMVAGCLALGSCVASLIMIYKEVVKIRIVIERTNGLSK